MEGMRMRYLPLGRTGVLVSELCLGTMTFGEGWGFGGIDTEHADAIVGAAIDAGINFIDTADVYSGGDSEALLGTALASQGRRDRVVLASKGLGRMGTGVNDTGLSRLYLTRACERSLQRLKTDRIDLYQIHGFDAATPLDEVARALEDLVRSGKVVYTGICNLAAWQLALLLGYLPPGHPARPVSAQMYYSLIGRDIEHEVIPLCRHQQLSVLPWSPLAGGFLTGKYRPDQTTFPAGSRYSTSQFGEFPPRNKEQAHQVADTLRRLAEAHKTEPATIAIRWLLNQAAVTSVIIGIRRLEQLQANLNATSLELPPEAWSELDELTKPPFLYPNWMIQRQSRYRNL